jgi:hypothetical protein
METARRERDGLLAHLPVPALKAQLRSESAWVGGKISGVGRLSTAPSAMTCSEGSKRA